PALLSDPRLAACDPALSSVENVNEPEDFAAARSRPAPRVAVTLHSSLGRAGDARYRDVRAANLGEAASAVGLTVDGVDDALSVRLNGHLVDPDPALPLLAGDDLVLAGADSGR
ncbi:MAG: molybdenum cofactor guanylyltransferase, partial [Nocardioidaceae bacterium]